MIRVPAGMLAGRDVRHLPHKLPERPKPTMEELAG